MGSGFLAVKIGILTNSNGYSRWKDKLTLRPVKLGRPDTMPIGPRSTGIHRPSVAKGHLRSGTGACRAVAPENAVKDRQKAYPDRASRSSAYHLRRGIRF